MNKPDSNKPTPELYGSGTGDHIALFRKVNSLNWDEVRKVLLGYSCYPPALPKIEQHLNEFGRYDCVVQSGWFRSQFANVGIKFKLYIHDVSILKKPLVSDMF